MWITGLVTVTVYIGHVPPELLLLSGPRPLLYMQMSSKSRWTQAEYFCLSYPEMRVCFAGKKSRKKKYPEGKTAAAVANAVVKPPPSAAQVWDSASIKQQDADKCDTCSFNYHHCYCCDYTTVMRAMRADMSKVWLWDQMWHLNRFYLAMTYFSTNNSQLNWY